MADSLSPVPKLSFMDNNGSPAVGYKLFTYAAGTSTKLATYVNSAGVTPNSNPIVLDYRGEANVWIPANTPYKYVFASPTDTDPPGNPIWSVDQVVSSQLLTLYAGVDTGSVNAYVVNFNANFTAYADGISFFWIPSNTNTGASTINVNGIGPVAIVQQSGQPLLSGQIQANQFVQLIYRGTGFVFVGPTSGSFTVTLTGVTVTTTGTAHWTKNGRLVTLVLPTLFGTSNSTTKSYTGLPSTLWPAFDTRLVTTGINNSGSALEVINTSIGAGSDVINFSRLTNDGLWNSSGICAVSGCTLVYEST